MRYLDPSIDIVFKLLFASEENAHLLRAMITAVLEPPSPIDALTVLNPELPSDLADTKTIVLDLRVQCADGTQFDVEMETEPREVFRPRLLFYWARLHAGQLSRGERYDQLGRTVSIAWLGGTLLPTDYFHSTYRAIDARTMHRLSDEFEIHILELPKRHHDATIPPALRRWADFFASPSEDTLARIANEDAIMSDAVKALEKVSRSPESQSLAEERQLARFNAALEEQYRRKALERAVTEGAREAVEQHTRELVARLTAQGRSDEEIAEILGLDEAQVDVIRRSSGA